MARAAKLDLRSFQQELASRLATKTAAQVESSRLGLACGGDRWLMRLADAGEVVAMPDVVPVPLTKPWYLGIANIREKKSVESLMKGMRLTTEESGGRRARSVETRSRGMRYFRPALCVLTGADMGEMDEDWQRWWREAIHRLRQFRRPVQRTALSLGLRQFAAHRRRRRPEVPHRKVRARCFGPPQQRVGLIKVFLLNRGARLPKELVHVATR